MHYCKKILYIFIGITGRIGKKKREKILERIGKKVGAILPYESWTRMSTLDTDYAIQLGTNKEIEDVQGIIVRQYCRLGNELIQIINAFYCAKKAGIKIIYLTWCPNFIQKKQYLIDGITLSFERKDIVGKCCMIGNFYNLEDHLIQKIPLKEYVNINKLIYTNLIDPNFKKDTFPGQANNDLVIHIRSGDIFGMWGIHPWYAQPPLAYYLTVLKLAQPGRVVLVYEDTGNPCIGALQEYLSDKDIHYLNFCKSLPETVSLLLHAKNICYGYGSFVPQIIFLSEKKKKTGYIYNNYNPRIHQKFKKLFLIQEQDEIYRNTVLKEWKNTTEQREKMVTYIDGNFEITVSE